MNAAEGRPDGLHPHSCKTVIISDRPTRITGSSRNFDRPEIVADRYAVAVEIVAPP
jgi:hypothetical protein